MILVTIIITLAVVWFVRRWDDDLESRALGALAGFMIGSVVAFLALVATSIKFGRSEPIISTDIYELVQIGDSVYPETGGTIRGVFVVSGRIDTTLSAGFSFYQKEGDGYTLKTAPAEQTVVKYTSETPMVEVTTTSCPKLEWRAFWFDNFVCDRAPTRYILYVPEGSIAENFSLGDTK